jgi:hypothetical protein
MAVILYTRVSTVEQTIQRQLGPEEASAKRGVPQQRLRWARNGGSMGARVGREVPASLRGGGSGTGGRPSQVMGTRPAPAATGR